MWLILVCSHWCGGEDPMRAARYANWSAPAAIAGIPTDDGDRQTWETPWQDDLAEPRFPSQSACLRELRRAMPAGHSRGGYANSGEGWEEESITHHRDYVSSFEAVGWEDDRATMVRSYYYACFQEAPRIW
jgi:hypothetical protein